MSDCSLIVVAYHGDAWLPDCLATLSNVLPAHPHLVLVDNAGNTCIGELNLDAFDVEVLDCTTPLGFAEANNLAMVGAQGLNEFVVFLNQDTISFEDWLTPCTECLREFPEVAAVTPLTRTYDGAGWDPYFLECAQKSADFDAAFAAGDALDPFYEVPVIPAAAMVMRASVLNEVGPFDPVFGSYYEDYDLCHRIRQAGYRVGVCTGGSVSHLSGSATNSEAAERRRAQWIVRNRIILGQRLTQGNRWKTFLRYAALRFPRELARSLVGRPGAKPLGPFLTAHKDLIRLTPRLVSVERDQAAWDTYLAEIGWPPSSLSREEGTT